MPSRGVVPVEIPKEGDKKNVGQTQKPSRHGRGGVDRLGPRVGFGSIVPDLFGAPLWCAPISGLGRYRRFGLQGLPNGPEEPRSSQEATVGFAALRLEDVGGLRDRFCPSIGLVVAKRGPPTRRDDPGAGE